MRVTLSQDELDSLIYACRMGCENLIKSGDAHKGDWIKLRKLWLMLWRKRHPDLVGESVSPYTPEVEYDHYAKR